MERNRNELTVEERTGMELRGIYHSHGYTPYKVCKFEPYDLYAANRSFITGEHILTFTDINGKLMALKPDITISIMKGYQGGEQKSYYNENVYREGITAREFREIPQAGVERIGHVDLCEEMEVLCMAAESLDYISKSWIMNIGSMQFLNGLLGETHCTAEALSQLLYCVKSKNRHEIDEICRQHSLDARTSKAWKTLAVLYGPFAETLPELEAIALNGLMRDACTELKSIEKVLSGTDFRHRVHLDFSIISDLDYYNGIVFQGFIEHVHAAVLSGGRYDHLAERFDKRAQAIGFAVYLDLLEQTSAPADRTDADVLLLYGHDAQPERVLEKAALLRSGGKTVRLALDEYRPEGQFGEIMTV